MADDDEPGGSPACFLNEVDAAYAGFLADAELGGFLETLCGREHALADAWHRLRASSAIRDARVASIAGDLGDAAALLTAALARFDRPAASPGPLRFADSSPALADFFASEAAVATALRTTLPRVRSDALHAMLRKVLCMHDAHLAVLETLVPR